MIIYFTATNWTIRSKKSTNPEGGIVFGYEVSDPERYGVVEYDKNMNVVSIEEKQRSLKAAFAVPGLYFYDNDVVEIAKNVQPSPRGELEITSVNSEYLRRGKLKVQTLDNGDVWLDTGTIDSLTDATDFVRVVQKRTGQIIGSPEKVALENSWITQNNSWYSLNHLKIRLRTIPKAINTIVCLHSISGWLLKAIYLNQLHAAIFKKSATSNLNI